MNYWGKLLSVIIALLSGSSIWTLIISFLIGHIIDTHVNGLYYFFNQNTRQKVFFYTTFHVIGRLTKSKGRVTEADILNVNILMKKMQLNTTLKNAAQEAFRKGKDKNFPLRSQLRKFRQVCFFRSDLIRLFLEIQIQAAFSDGVLHPNERQILYIIAEELGISHNQFNIFLNMIEGRENKSQDHQFHFHYNQSSPPQEQEEITIKQAYKVLGVKPGDDRSVIKRAYRKLMSQHHPDKLMAQGLPADMMERAKKKTQIIQHAYDLLKREKK